MELRGTVHEIYDTVQITDTFKKREIVIEYAENPAYPEYVKMEAIQDKCSLFDNLNKGDMVDLSFNLKGRAWNDPKTGKTNYFNTLQIWRVSPANSMQQANTMQNVSSQAGVMSNNPSVSTNSITDDDTDLPF